jgi:hypothetical protein
MFVESVFVEEFVFGVSLVLFGVVVSLIED